MKLAFQPQQKMNIRFKIILLVVVIVIASIKGLFGQMSMDIIQDPLKEDLLPEIEPLDTLIKSALLNAPTLKVHDKIIEIKATERQLKKKQFLDRISVGGAALFGTGTIYDAWTDGQNPSDFTTFRRNLAYNAGLNIRFTAGDIVNGKERRQLAKLELERSILERKTTEQVIREEVIRRYEDLLFCVEMIDIKASNLEAMRLSLEVAEEYFKAGNLQVDVYSTALAKKIKAEEEFEAAKAKARYCKRILDEIVNP